VKENNSDQIFYTLDGSVPNNQLSLYSAPIIINQTTPVRIKVYRNGALPSPVLTHTYFFEENLNLSVISLVTAHSNFWGSTGIYQNYNSGEERPVHIEYFEQDGTPGFSLDGGVKIHAPEARTQKSLRLYARPEYGKSKIDYKIFDDKEIDNFECLVLRNGGNDGAQINKTQIRDVYVHKIYQNLNPDYATSAYRPVHVFINGDYWGIYDLRERQDEDYIKANFGFEKEEIDFLEYDHAEPGYMKTIAGDWNDFNNLKSFVLNNDMSVPANYNTMIDWMDMDNFIDYQITEILIGNQDWCNNNIKFWRPRAAGGKWKWVLWDTEYGLGTFRNHDVGKPNFNFFHMAMTWCGWGDGDYTWLLRKLMANEEFKWQFISRSLDLLNSGLKPSYTINFFDELAEGIAPDMQKQFDRWGSNNTTWTNDLNYTRDFITQRPDHYHRHIANELGFDPALHELSVDVSDPAMGWVKINTILIGENTPGIETPPYPWSGGYFGATSVRVKAIARPGYQFVRWEGISNSTNEEITIQLSGDGGLTAIFESGGSTGFNDSERNNDNVIHIYPVPAKDHITIQINDSDARTCIIQFANSVGQIMAVQQVQLLTDDVFEMDVRAYPAGIYFLTAKFPDGKAVTKKILIK
jgi:hypothetical protein